MPSFVDVKNVNWYMLFRGKFGYMHQKLLKYLYSDSEIPSLRI